MEDYSIYTECTPCGNRAHFPLTKKEAAFDLYDRHLFKKPCHQCGAAVNAYSMDKPAIDKELLDIWGQDEELYFLSQDEDLILADKTLLDILLQAIDEEKYLESKMHTMIYALLVLLRDLYRDKSQQEVYETVLQEALKRKAIIEKYRMGKDYITKVAYPLLGL